jgi:hypothetical protein
MWRNGGPVYREALMVPSSCLRYHHTLQTSGVWGTIADKPGIAAAMVRDDGAILARQPNADIPTLPLTSPLMQAIATGDFGFYRGISSIDGRERLYGFRKISDYPVYVGYGVSVNVALRA